MCERERVREQERDANGESVRKREREGERERERDGPIGEVSTKKAKMISLLCSHISLFLCSLHER